MSVVIEQVTHAKTGRSLRVLLSGKWYGAYLDSGLNDPTLIGRSVEADIVTTEKAGPWIKGWKPCAIPAAPTATPQVQAQPAPTPPPPPAAVATTRVPEPQYAEPNTNVAPWWMPFVSNTVAHAIQAGLIKTPQEIRAWLIAAKVAAKTHDQDIPF